MTEIFVHVVLVTGLPSSASWQDLKVKFLSSSIIHFLWLACIIEIPFFSSFDYPYPFAFWHVCGLCRVCLQVCFLCV